MKEAYNYLLSILNDNDYVVIGVSGGADSMALLHLLITVRKTIKINIVCAHINHNVRKESDEEKEFVEDYCDKNNVIFEYMKIESFNKDNFTESIARKIRYDFFKSLIKKYNAKILFTAHHGDDLMETILMRLTRGSTLKGYAGFSKETTIDNYKIIRPLIHYTKDEILEYNKLNNIVYVNDLTNDNDIYTRNRYRHNVLPFFKNEDINVNHKFLKFSELLFDYSNYVDDIVLSNMNDVYKNNILDIRQFNRLDNLIAKRVINYILETIYNNDLVLISNIHVDSILDLINSSKPNGSIILPNKVLIVKSYDKLSFNVELKKNNDYEFILEDDLYLPNGGKISYVDSEKTDSNFVCRLDSNDIKLPLHVRNKRDGDVIDVKGLDGIKKIKDIFINEKIPLRDRQNWPVVLDENGIVVWLPGIKKSKYNKKINEKYDIIIKYDYEEEK